MCGGDAGWAGRVPFDARGGIEPPDRPSEEETAPPRPRSTGVCGVCGLQAKWVEWGREGAPNRAHRMLAHRQPSHQYQLQ